MKRILAGFAVLAATANVAAQTAQKLASGLEFAAPAGWVLKAVDQAALLTPPDAVADSEVYVVASVAGGQNLGDPNRVTQFVSQYFPAGAGMKAVGTPQPFEAKGGKGTLYKYDFVQNGVSGRLQLFIVELKGGGEAAVIAAATHDLAKRREANVAAVARSLFQGARVASAGNAGPLAKQWTERLRDKKLVQFSSYSSGSSGGYNSQRTIYLASDGSYAFRSSSSVSVYVPGASGTSAGKDGSDGKWRVYEQNGAPVLELRSGSGDKETFTLSTEGGKTFLNGRRWFMVGINE